MISTELNGREGKNRNKKMQGEVMMQDTGAIMNIHIGTTESTEQEKL
jgi:hypothetical protein